MNKDIDKALEFTKIVTPKILIMAIVILLTSKDVMTVPWIVLSTAVISSIAFMPIIDVTYCKNYTLIITIAVVLLLSSQMASIILSLNSEYKIMLNKIFLFGGVYVTLLNLILGGMAILKIVKLKKKTNEDKNGE